MNQNSIIEMGSKADVVISFPVETEINGKIYAAFEPYLYLKDVKAILEFQDFTKNNSSVKNMANINLAAINKLLITDIVLSKKLLSLFLCLVAANVSEERRMFKTYAADGTTIYLVDEINDLTSVYIYDSNFSKITTASYDAVTNSYTSVDFVDGENYLISFSSELIGTKFKLKQNSFSYMNIEIQGIGNIDKITKKVLIHLEKASLNSLIDFNFLPGERLVMPLEFSIIANDNDFIIFED